MKKAEAPLILVALLVCALLFVLCSSAQAQQAQQQMLHRVGVLVFNPDIPSMKGLRDGLKGAGYIEGKNLILDVPALETNDRLREIAKTYVERKFSVIVGMGGTAPLAAKQLTREIPIVFVGSADPIAAGLVKSVARPEGNVTGVTMATDAEIEGKRLEVFREAVPTLRRVTVFYNARGENPGHAKRLSSVQKVASALGLVLIEKPIKSAADIEQALASVQKDTTDGLFLICSTLFRDSQTKITAIAVQKRLPLTGCRDAGQKGYLLFYRTDGYRVGHRAAWYVDRILKGTKPQDLPVEAPTYFELVINLKAAKQHGLTIPPNVLARADRVIK
jgi:putative ABC transport system substrate-binding protein